MRKKGGFTLLETLIYAALIAFVIAFVLQGIYSIVESRYRLLAKAEVEDETTFLMRKIAWALGSVSGINQPAPGATSTILSVNKFNFSQNPIVIQASSSVATIAYGGGPATPLTSENVAVTGLAFQRVGTSTNPGIKVTLNISFLPGGQVFISPGTSTVETTIYGRKQ